MIDAKKRRGVEFVSRGYGRTSNSQAEESINRLCLTAGDNGMVNWYKTSINVNRFPVKLLIGLELGLTARPRNIRVTSGLTQAPLDGGSVKES